MRNRESAELMLRRAKIIWEEAKSLHAKGAWNLVVRRCQECVELALKSALVWAGIQAPRVHDVGPTLKQHADKFPDKFARHITQLASISRSLRVERELSFYGDEESGMPPEALYSQSDAEEALQKAEFVLRQCEALLEG